MNGKRALGRVSWSEEIHGREERQTMRSSKSTSKTWRKRWREQVKKEERIDRVTDVRKSSESIEFGKEVRVREVERQSNSGGIKMRKGEIDTDTQNKQTSEAGFHLDCCIYVSLPCSLICTNNQCSDHLGFHCPAPVCLCVFMCLFSTKLSLFFLSR